MKILHVCDWYRPFGGAERLLFATLEELEAAGHENIVIAHSFEGQQRTHRRPEYFVDHLEIDFTAISAFKLRRQLIGRLQSEVSEIIDRHRPQVVHVHNLQNPFVIEVLTGALPCVRSIHDPRLYCFTDWRLLPNKEVCPHKMGRRCITEGCLPLNPFRMSKVAKQAPFRAMHLKAHRGIETLIAESHAVYNCLVQNGFRPEHIALLPNFTQVYGTWDEICRFNRRYENPNERVVLFVGRASYEKGIDCLIDAMLEVPKPWKLILVTGGEYLAKVRAKIGAMGIEDSIEIPGVLDYQTTRTYYARANVVVFPSLWMESFGLVGLEAMANGKPVVGFRTGGIPEWLEDGKTGLLAPLKDVAGLAKRIRLLLEDGELAQEMGRQGYESVIQNFNKDVYVDRLLKIYEAAIDKRGHDGSSLRETSALPAQV